MGEKLHDLIIMDWKKQKNMNEKEKIRLYFDVYFTFKLLETIWTQLNCYNKVQCDRKHEHSFVYIQAV